MEYTVEQLLNLPENEVYKKIVEILYPDYPQAFEAANKILCVAPHPDDCELGVGGLIAKYSSMGREVYIIVVTDGSKGTTNTSIMPEELATIRRKEVEEACKLLGVKEIFWLGYKDGELEYSKDLFNNIISLIRLIKPDIVLAPDPTLKYEFHPDHIVTGRVTGSAVLFSGMPYFNYIDLEKKIEPHSVKYLGLYYTSNPNYYIDITGYFDKKLEALKLHKSQFQEIWDLFSKLVYLEARVHGKKINKQFAEAIRLLPTLLLHVYSFSEHI